MNRSEGADRCATVAESECPAGCIGDWYVDECAVYGRMSANMRVMTFVVDTGCNVNLLSDNEQMRELMYDTRDAERNVLGFSDGMKSQAGLDGMMCVQFVDRERVPVGTVKIIAASTMRGARWNLMSILWIVFELGFIFVVTPDDFIGFIRLGDDGSVEERLPCYVDPGTGLIMIDFVVTPSEDQSDMVCNGGLSDEIRLVDREAVDEWTEFANERFAALEEKEVCDGSCVMGECSICECEDRWKSLSATCRPAQSSGGCHALSGVSERGDNGLAVDVDALEVESTENDEFDRLFQECDSVVTQTLRPGDKKLTAKQRHEKFGHIGYLEGCSICQQLRKTRRVYRAVVRHLDGVPGRTWSWDAWEANNRNWEGLKYCVGGRDEMSGYMDAAFIATKDQAIDAMIERVLTMRNDPMFGEKREMICTRIYVDPAGEWNTRFSNGQERLRGAGIEVIQRAAAADKGQMRWEKCVRV